VTGSFNGSGNPNGEASGRRGWWPFRKRPKGDGSESFRQLALQLHLDLSDLDGGRAVMLSTSVDSDLCMGTTLELAWFLAEEHGHRVLVVDGSLVGQELTHRMGCEGAEGLLDFLADDVEPDGGRLLATDHPLVWFGPAGQRQVGMGMGQALVRRRLDAGLNWFRGAYDYLLLYTPPLLDDAAGLGFASVVDCVLLLAEEGKSRLDELDKCQDMLMAQGAKHVGLVLTNAVRTRRRWSLRRR
jgi:Mrp family chromosome partitioning ATPase